MTRQSPDDAACFAAALWRSCNIVTRSDMQWRVPGEVACAPFLVIRSAGVWRLPPFCTRPDRLLFPSAFWGIRHSAAQLAVVAAAGVVASCTQCMA